MKYNTLSIFAIFSKYQLIMVCLFLFHCITPIFSLAKFEPEDGKTLLIIGQDTKSIKTYIKRIKVAPSGIMMYTNLYLGGMTSPIDYGSGENDFQYWSKQNPDLIIQIGLHLSGVLYEANLGYKDQNIDMMAKTIKNAGNPVFLRIGYEFDSDWASLNPDEYKKAFIRIVNRFRALAVDNVAFVWHSWGIEPYKNYTIDMFYPGDEYVDWCAVSFFKTNADKPRAKMVEFAQQHNKPLMIAESCPLKFYHDTQNNQYWYTWLEKVFRFIEDNDVKAFSYINVNWESHDMWKGKNFGDTRLQKYKKIKQLWKNEITKDRYIHLHDLNPFENTISSNLKFNKRKANLRPNPKAISGLWYGGFFY